METYYHSNPKIEEWAGGIIEKILTVCILSGADSEVEYQKGCQLIAKITDLLQSFSGIPEEYLADGLKQIIEQQLPDSRVISNFPTFLDTMNRMIKDGMLTLQAQPALAVLHHESKNTDRLVDSTNQELTEFVEQKTDSECIDEENKMLSRAQLHRENREHIKKLLPYLLPNETIQWDVMILGQTFLAQVNDILLYCTEQDQGFKEEAYIKDGWKVMIVCEEDLAYPRRLERELKNLMRKGKKIK